MNSRNILIVSLAAIGLSLLTAGWNFTHRPVEAPFVGAWPELVKAKYGSTVKMGWEAHHAAVCQLEKLTQGGQPHLLKSVGLKGTTVIGPVNRLTVMKITCETKTKWHEGTGMSRYAQAISVIDVSPAPKV